MVPAMEKSLISLQSCFLPLDHYLFFTDESTLLSQDINKLNHALMTT